MVLVIGYYFQFHFVVIASCPLLSFSISSSPVFPVFCFPLMFPVFCFPPVFPVFCFPPVFPVFCFPPVFPLFCFLPVFPMYCFPPVFPVFCFLPVSSVPFPSCVPNVLCSSYASVLLPSPIFPLHTCLTSASRALTCIQCLSTCTTFTSLVFI